MFHHRLYDFHWFNLNFYQQYFLIPWKPSLLKIGCGWYIITIGDYWPQMMTTDDKLNLAITARKFSGFNNIKPKKTNLSQISVNFSNLFSLYQYKVMINMGLIRKFTIIIITIVYSNFVCNLWFYCIFEKKMFLIVLFALDHRNFPAECTFT